MGDTHMPPPHDHLLVLFYLPELGLAYTNDYQHWLVIKRCYSLINGSIKLNCLFHWSIATSKYRGVGLNVFLGKISSFFDKEIGEFLEFYFVFLM